MNAFSQAADEMVARSGLFRSGRWYCLTAYEILMIVITVALLIVEIIKLCKSDNKK